MDPQLAAHLLTPHLPVVQPEQLHAEQRGLSGLGKALYRRGPVLDAAGIRIDSK
jgi:hypothetical protein